MRVDPKLLDQAAAGIGFLYKSFVASKMDLGLELYPGSFSGFGDVAQPDATQRFRGPSEEELQ